MLLVEVFIAVTFTTFVVGQTNELDSWSYMCPKMYLHIFKSYAPKGNDSAGVFYKKDTIHTLETCVASCCSSDNCNVVFMLDDLCFHIQCKTNDLCAPLYRTEPTFTDHATMVLVQPLPGVDSWTEVLDLPSEDYYRRNNDLMMDGSDQQYLIKTTPKTCEVGIDLYCPPNEECVTQIVHSRNGICQCIKGFVRNSSGICEEDVTHIDLGKFVDDSVNPISTGSAVEPTKMYSEGSDGDNPIQGTSESSSTKPLKQLTVSATTKEVRLPENNVTLSAYTIPAEQSGEHYKYEWTLLSQPIGENGGTMNDRSGSTLKLTHLSEGLYTFKVAVTAPGAYGEALANVTVLPPKRINQPPIAIITPPSQTVKLPNTGAVLDGSTSKDDDAIKSWHWELQQGPIGYQPHLADQPTLQLDNLNLTGNYTFKLTVEDSDGETNFTTANITVLKVTDYPPEANAGQDFIVYLPLNNATLNGNLSTDDRGITSWEWTKSPSDQDKAVDMQNTRTPYLQLSNLEEGMYTFVLKVTDNSEQSSSAEVHVFVKQPTNKPPVANAGADRELSLPQTWTILDGSQSTDDIKIVSWHWEQIKGPTKVIFSAANSSVTNVTDLTKGVYEFQLAVIDENNNEAKDSVVVTVTQNKNAPPKANGGGDQTVVLPVSVITLNGSQSSDDLGIVKWQWTREAASLALGRILSNSDETPILLLTDVVPGRYVFRLKVEDEQGATSEDTVSIIVKPDPNFFNLVELTLNIEGQQLTQQQMDSLDQKLSLLLHEEAILHIRQLREEDHTARAVMVFYVELKDNHEIMPGPTVVRRLRERLTQDQGLLQLSVASIQTSVCQNNCSGHGVCEEATRECLCEAFWMQDLIGKYLGDGEANCDWSILYVVIVMFICIVFFVGGGWGLACLCQRACARRPTKRPKYSLLGADAEGEGLIHRVTHGKIISESDSDSEVLFECQKSKFNGDLRNGHIKVKNGFGKRGRRIKT